jgi:hypothetical protein
MSSAVVSGRFTPSLVAGLPSFANEQNLRSDRREPAGNDGADGGIAGDHLQEDRLPRPYQGANRSDDAAAQAIVSMPGFNLEACLPSAREPRPTATIARSSGSANRPTSLR